MSLAFNIKSVLKKVIRTSGHLALGPLERKLINYAQGNASPPCFIIGSPRSGTTLLYALLITKYEFSYFSNLCNIFPQAPVAISYLEKRFKSSWGGNTQSNYGALKGLGAPSEAGKIWGRWIPEFDYLDHTAVDKKKSFLMEAPQIVKAIQNEHMAPFINKNVMHGVHIKLLDKVFKDCLFIEIRRQIKPNVRSIVRAREKGGGPALDKNGWWSVKPRGVERFYNLSYEEQACAQISCLRRDIEESIQKIGKNRRIIVSYERLCENPKRELNQIVEFISPFTGRIQVRNEFLKKLRCSSSPLLSNEAENRIESTMTFWGMK